MWCVFFCQWKLTQPKYRNCFVCLSFQDIDCYVIDNHGFVLISKQRSDVSSHIHYILD